MNALNHAVTSAFDALLAPLEALGRPLALILVSGIFGVLALLAFRQISWQKGIKAAKDKIKAHLIEIRIYQDDLGIVTRAIGKVLLRNLQYLGLNLVPFVPLALPFAFVLAQLVVRYGFAPVPLSEGAVGAGRGTLIEVSLAPGRADLVRGLEIALPEGLEPRSPLVRLPGEGRAFQEVVARRAGAHEIAFSLSNGERATKVLAAGEGLRSMQPERGRGFLAALLWPAEDAFGSDSAFERIAFAYPESDLGWLPGGAGGVVIVFLAASMLFGALAIKPLGIEI
jgi:hypothetical protein